MFKKSKPAEKAAPEAESPVTPLAAFRTYENATAVFVRTEMSGVEWVPLVTRAEVDLLIYALDTAWEKHIIHKRVIQQRKELASLVGEQQTGKEEGAP